MSVNSVIDDFRRLHIREAGRGTNPPRAAVSGVAVGAGSGAGRAIQSLDRRPTAPAVARRSGQLPAFAPLLDELEIAGWTSHRRALSGNFHDWLMLERRTILVAVGQAVGVEPVDATEAALVAQSAWATLRAHAHHVRDAGELLSLAARSLWPAPNQAVQAAVAVALVDTTEGKASLAMAGDCLAWRIRAALCEQLALDQPMLGAAAGFTYASQMVQLSLRERLLLMADNPLRRAAKLATSIESSFARQSAESHRRMMAADVVALARRQVDRGPEDDRAPASIVAVRRR